MREVRSALPNLSLYLMSQALDGEAMATDAAIDAMADAARVYGAEHVRFAGRDACRHPKLDQLIDAAIDAGLSWQPCVDGTDVSLLLAVLNDQRRAGLLLPYLTLDAADESIHDSARGVGTYRGALQTLATMAALDIPTEVHIELHRLNQADFEQTCMLALKLGAERIVLSLAMPPTSELAPLLALSADALPALAERAARVVEVLAIDVDVDPSLRSEPPFRRCEALDGRWLHFGPSGKLAPCDKHIGTGGGAAASDAHLAQGLVSAHGALLDIASQFYASRLAQVHGANAPLESPCTHCLRMFGCAHWSAERSTLDAAPGATPSWRQDWAAVAAFE